MVLPIVRVIAAAALAAPLMANAVVYQFNASLNGANERPTPVVTSATGIATLSYDDQGTAGVFDDDTYDFALSVFGLGAPASVFHIHGPATTAANAAPIVTLSGAPFLSLISGGNLLVGGSGVAPPSSSFLATLQGGLAYVNVHTALNPGGEVRGQLVQVAVVPEPEIYALLLAGLGLVGAAVRRRKAGVKS